MARPVPHACTEPYQPGIAVAGIQIHATATITDWIQPSYNPTSFPGSPLPSLGTDRREPWERGWLQFWTEEIGNLVIPPPPPSPRKKSSYFSSGIVERAKRECAWKQSHARKARRSGDFHARWRFPRSTIPEGKWGLLVIQRENGTFWFLRGFIPDLGEIGVSLPRRVCCSILFCPRL